LQCFIHHRIQRLFSDADVGGLGLLGGQFEDVCLDGFLNEARQVSFPATAVAGKEQAQGLVGVSGDSDIPADCAYGGLLWSVFMCLYAGCGEGCNRYRWASIGLECAL